MRPLLFGIFLIIAIAVSSQETALQHTPKPVLVDDTYSSRFKNHNDSVNHSKTYLLSTVNQEFQFTFINLEDPYLSPLVYSGVGVAYQFSKARYFRNAIKRWYWQSQSNLLMGIAANPSGNSNINYVGGDLGWGVYHHVPAAVANLKIDAGINSFLNIASKLKSDNVNNPANVDVALMTAFAAKARYQFLLKRKPMELNLKLQIPIVGAMYVPMQGATYYEMFSLGNLKNVFHIASLHNYRAMNTSFYVDFPLQNSSLTLGVLSHVKMHQANAQIYRFNSMGLLVGWKYDFYRFGGRKNQAPAHFISTNKY